MSITVDFAALMILFFIIAIILSFIRIMPILPGNPILKEFGKRTKKGAAACAVPP